MFQRLPAFSVLMLKYNGTFWRYMTEIIRGEITYPDLPRKLGPLRHADLPLGRPRDRAASARSRPGDALAGHVTNYSTLSYFAFGDTRSQTRGGGVPSYVGVGGTGVAVRRSTAAVAAHTVAVADAGVFVGSGT